MTINLLPPNTKYGPRLNQVDMRFGKVLRFGEHRARVNVDLYNALNGNTPQGFNATYGPVWLRPNAILTARFMKFSLQYDF